MRPVVIVLLDPAGDTAPRFCQTAVLRRPHFLFFQAAMELDKPSLAKEYIVETAIRDAAFILEKIDKHWSAQ